MQRPGSANGSPAHRHAPWWQLWSWWIVSVCGALVHNGLWATPNLGFMATIAQNPGTNPFSSALPGDYLLTSISMPTLAALLRQTEAHQVARLHLVVLLVGWAGVVALARCRFGHPVARNLTVMLAASPVVTVSMQWLGQPDPVTALCGIAMVLVRRWWVVLALGVLAGLTHPEQALFMALAAGAMRALLPEAGLADAPGDPDTSDHRPDWRPLLSGTAAAAGGVVLGRSLTQVWFWIADISIEVPRSEYVDSGFATFFEHHTQASVALLWSLWGPSWLVVAALVVMALTGWLHTDESGAGSTSWASWARWAPWAMAGIAVLALLPAFVTLDETRVYAVLTAPLLAGASIWLARALPERSLLRGAAALLVITALAPGTMATGTSSSRQDLDTRAMLSFLADGSIPAAYQDPEQGPLMTEWLLSPFDIVLDDPGA